MLTALPPSVKIYVALGATDLRRSVDGLSVLVREALELEPFSGHLFLQVVDMESLRGQAAEIASLRGQVAEMEVLRIQLLGRERQIRTLQAQLDELARRVFGKKSEKLDPRQLRLALDLLASAVETRSRGHA